MSCLLLLKFFIIHCSPCVFNVVFIHRASNNSGNQINGDNKNFLYIFVFPDIFRIFHIRISFLKYSHIFIFRTKVFLVIKEKYVHAMLTVTRGVYKATSSCNVYSYCSLVHGLTFTILLNSLIMLYTGCVITELVPPKPLPRGVILIIIALENA